MCAGNGLSVEEKNVHATTLTARNISAGKYMRIPSAAVSVRSGLFPLLNTSAKGFANENKTA